MSLIDQKKIHIDYEILETFDAGIELFGHEVKSIKAHLGSLTGSFITVRNGQAILRKAFIPPYQEKNTPPGYDAYRNRRLLLTKKEIRELQDIQKGLTILPISMYSKGNLIKVSLGLGRKKKRFDKREKLKKKTMMRDAEREASE